MIFHRERGVYVLLIGNKKGLKECYEQALQRDDVKAIVVTGAKGKFSGGFDITAFGGMQGGKIAPPKPGFMSVEVLTDTVEGGGLEVAMACHARISTPSAQLGLPELRLGVIPGFGGTQRLPRLVGLSKALEMMLTSKLVRGEEAHDLGLVDATVSPDELINTACQWALDILEAKRPWVKSLYKTDKIEPLGEAREILKFARTQARKQAPNLEHPIGCINVVEEGIVSGPRAGLWKEVEAFQGLLHSDTCKSLIHIFFAQRGTSRVPGITDRGLVPRRISKVAILGGGLMGSGIATTLILSNYPVVLKEVNENFLQAGVGRVIANLQSRVKKGKMNEEKFLKTLSLLKGVLDYESFRDVDMVIEDVLFCLSNVVQISIRLIGQSPNLECLWVHSVDPETALYTELWRACASPLVIVPLEGERVFYCPQGHIEQALIWSKMSTGLPIDISSSMKGQNYSSFCRLDIDIHRLINGITDGTFFQLDWFH
ncbi:hypothetical protein ACSBR2_013578 [Camellia fascicularis]